MGRTCSRCGYFQCKCGLDSYEKHGYMKTHSEERRDERQDKIKQLQAKNEEQEEFINWLCNEEPCPKCGYGVTGACYGCEIKKLQTKIKRLENSQDEDVDIIEGYVGLTEKLQAKNKRLRESLERLQQWAKAYPLSVFPEPDFVKVRKALKAYGISLDAVSASNMRHVIKGISKIVEQALKDEK